MFQKGGSFVPVNQSQTADLLATVRQDVDAFLSSFFETQITRAMAVDESYAQLWRTLKTVALAGGKRLRPYMTVLAYQSFSNQKFDDIVPVASAQELLHISMLMHDDIIDEDYIRHDAANVGGTYLKRYQPYLQNPDKLHHYANSAALIGGDLVLSAAHQAINMSRLNYDQKQLANDILNDAIFIVCGGELLDTESSFLPQESIDALKIAQLKTASYSFVSPLIMGASLAGAPQPALDSLRQFGTNLGIAFQLADDILGMYGNEKITGKSNSSDLRQGKRTYMLQLALEKSGSERAKLESLVGKSGVSPEELQAAQTIIEACGARSATEALIREYAEAAHTTLASLNLPEVYEAQYVALIKKATERNR